MPRHCKQQAALEEEQAKAELLHLQRVYAEEEKAIEEKEKKALKARAEAEAGVFEDGKSKLPICCTSSQLARN